MSLMPGISIIICCHNSVKRLKPTLLHISNQNLLNDFEYELIIVDNASEDNTADFARKEWEALPPSRIELKVVSENKAGLAYARAKGVEASRYDYLIFCDDDNWLAPAYTGIVINFFEKTPNVAVIGGNAEPVFNEGILIPDWFNKFSGSYALGMQSSESNIEMSLVYGAGMAVRKWALNSLEPKKNPTYLADRRGKKLTAGGDGELCFKLKLAGHQIAYLSNLKLQHYISDERLNWSYLKKLHKGFAQSFVTLDLYQRALQTQDLKLSTFYWLKKMLYYWWIYLKYWPTHFSAYSKSDGTTEEIHHITWRTIAISYLQYNFKTVEMYSKIVLLKQTP
jgi:glycosyltransferase involved in cell wall biosynthesis